MGCVAEADSGMATTGSGSSIPAIPSAAARVATKFAGAPRLAFPLTPPGSTSPLLVLRLQPQRLNRTPIQLLPPSGTSDGDAVLASANDWASLIASATKVAAQQVKSLEGVSDYLETLNKVLQMLGILQDAAPATQADLANLSNQLNQLAGAITWGFTEQDRENIFGNLVGDLLSVQDAINQNQVPISVSSALAVNSQNSLTQAEQPIYYQRLAALDGANDGDPVFDSPNYGWTSWKNIIPDRPAVENGWAYDWRLGVPWFMQLATMRLPVIAAEDPNFIFDGSFGGDLAQYAQSLSNQKQTMVDGVRCNTTTAPISDVDGTGLGYEYWVACADIYSGLSSGSTTPVSVSSGWPFNAVFGGESLRNPCCQGQEGGNWVCDSGCMAQGQADFNAWYQQNIAPLPAQYRAAVLAQMPLADIDATVAHLQTPGCSSDQLCNTRCCPRGWVCTSWSSSTCE
jgi:hypothetical protein